MDVFIYQLEHKANVTCVKISPTGFYVASAGRNWIFFSLLSIRESILIHIAIDANARVVVWDPIGEDHVTKLDKQTIAVVNDIAWSDDGKRVVVVGKGATVMGDAFFMDGGASCGDITGHLSPLLSVDIKQTRPFRLATGGEDMNIGWFEGPPFKPKNKIQNVLIIF